jgi:NADPH2:quinone reductase
VPQALTVREFGGPEAPVVEERAELAPGAGEVVVDLRASALNRRDLRVIAGGWPGVSAPVSPARMVRGSCARSAPACRAWRRATRS